MTKDEMVGWHQQLSGHEFEQALKDAERQESLMCCSPWGRKELNTTEQLNNNKQLQQTSCDFKKYLLVIVLYPRT